MGDNVAEFVRTYLPRAPRTGRVCVSGATGFLGANVVQSLLSTAAADLKLREIVLFGLPGSNVDYLPPPGPTAAGVNIVHAFGDCTVAADVEAAVKGCDVVWHIAGDTSFWRRHYARQHRVNVGGAECVARACVKHRVKRLVHTSTIDTIGSDPSGGVVDEAWPEDKFNYPWYNYATTKREGERRVLAYNGAGVAGPDGLEVVVLNPGSMIGPYDFTLQYGRLFFDLRDGEVPGSPSGGSSWAHVADVADAHVSAALRGRPGERYIVGGENLSYKDLFGKIATKMGGKAAPRLVLPCIILWLYGYIMEIVSWFTSKPPDMNPEQARYMSCFPRASSEKARKELGYESRSLETQIDDAYDWYKANGFMTKEKKEN